MPHADTNTRGKHFELVSTLLQPFEWSIPNGLQPERLDMSEAICHTCLLFCNNLGA